MTLSDGLECCGLLVDYCDVFISCLDSHSDGTHSLQRIHYWASDVLLNVFKSDKETNSSTSWMTWGWVFSANIHFWVNYSFNQMDLDDLAVACKIRNSLLTNQHPGPELSAIITSQVCRPQLLNLCKLFLYVLFGEDWTDKRWLFTKELFWQTAMSSTYPSPKIEQRIHNLSKNSSTSTWVLPCLHSHWRTVKYFLARVTFDCLISKHTHWTFYKPRELLTSMAL